MNLGLVLSLVMHGALLLWALVSIHATAPLKPPSEKPIEVSILMEAGENKSKQGDSSSKLKDTAGAEGTATKVPPKVTKQAMPAPSSAPPPPPAEKPAPPEPAPVKSEPVKEEPPPPAPPVQPSEADKKSLDEIIKAEQAKAAKEAAEQQQREKDAADAKAADEAAKAEAAAKAAAAAAAKAKADAERKERERKLAEQRRERERQKKLAEEKERQRLAEEAKKKQFNPSSIADAINNSKNPNDAPPTALNNQRPTAAPAAGARNPNSKLPPGQQAGTKDGRDNQITGDEARMLFNMLRQQVSRCWNINAGGQDVANMRPVFAFDLNQDGSLRGEPRLMNPNASPAFVDAANSALRAIKGCAPYKLPPDLYQHWQGVDLEFDPSKMFR